MGVHAKKFNVVVDTMLAYLTLLAAFVTVSWRVSTGKHAWRPLPEVGATPAWGDEMHGWNADPPTVEFAPVSWPTVDSDVSPEARAEIAADVRFERTRDASDRYTEDNQDG